MQTAFQQKPLRYTYYEFDGIHVFYTTKNIQTYRELLPLVFDMPDEPLVWAFVADYYKMDSATQPYLEAAIFLLANYKGEKAWHCITMPVTSDDARKGGIKNLGYPKIMGDVTLNRGASMYTGTLAIQGKTVMTITLEVKNNEVSKSEEEWFRKLAGIRSLNILNGQVFEPKFGDRVNLLETSRKFPDKFMIQAGRSELMLAPETAALHAGRLAMALSLKPAEIVLAYYLKNKFVLRFRN